MYESSFCSTSSLAFGVVIVPEFGYSNKCVVGSQYFFKFVSSLLVPASKGLFPCTVRCWLGWTVKEQVMVCPRQNSREVRAKCQSFPPTHWGDTISGYCQFQAVATHLLTHNRSRLCPHRAHILLLLLLLISDTYIFLLLLYFVFQC